MRKLMVYLDDDLHEDLRLLALRSETTMAALVRFAIGKTFEDELDAIGAERVLDEAARDPSDTMSWEEYKSQRTFQRAPAAGAERPIRTRPRRANMRKF